MGALHNGPVNFVQRLELHGRSVVVASETVQPLFDIFPEPIQFILLMVAHFFDVCRLNWECIKGMKFVKGKTLSVQVNLLLTCSFCFSEAAGGLSIEFRIDPSKSMARGLRCQKNQFRFRNCLVLNVLKLLLENELHAFYGSLGLFGLGLLL